MNVNELSIGGINSDLRGRNIHSNAKKENVQKQPQMKEYCSSKSSLACQNTALALINIQKQESSIKNQKADSAETVQPKQTEAKKDEPKEVYFDSLSPAEQKIVLENNIKTDDKFGINAILKRKITDFDTDMVLEARYQDVKNGQLKPEDLPMEKRIEITDKFLEKMEEIPKEKSFVIVTGRGGSGKSTIIRELGLDKNHMLMDSDEVKPLVPGFKEYGANYVHKVSVDINNALFEDALEQGTNIVFPTTGWHDYVEELINKAHEAGYNVQLIHSNIDSEKSMERAIKRFTDGEMLPDGTTMHRFVDPAYIQNGTYVDTVVDKFKDHQFIDRDILVFDNNGTYPPKLTEKIEK